MLGWVAGFFEPGIGFHSAQLNSLHNICFTSVLKIGNREDSQRTLRVSNYSTDKHITFFNLPCRSLIMILKGKSTCNIYILLDVLLRSIAEYFYELCRILASP